jgi:hypothetical protein
MLNTLERIASYFSLIIIIIGCVGNTISFLIFRFDKDMKKMSSMMVLSFLSITDTISLFEWNLDHFIANNFETSIFYESIFSCRLLLFLQYWSIQCSGFLVSLLSIDRYFIIASRPGSFGSGKLFGKPKTAFIESIFIMIFFMILNSHVLMFNGWKEENFNLNNTNLNYTIHCYEYTIDFDITLYEKFNIMTYCFIPFGLMLTFNLLIMKKLYFKRKNKVTSILPSTIGSLNSRKKLSITLIVISIAYIIMTVPSVIIFGFINPNVKYFKIISLLLDDLSFLNNTSVFFICYITNPRFRKIFNNKIENIFKNF